MHHDVVLVFLQMFDGSQTLLPADQLKKNFEQEGKFVNFCLVVKFYSVFPGFLFLATVCIMKRLLYPKTKPLIQVLSLTGFGEGVQT